MLVVFISNFINHHQVHVADELYKLLDGNYCFIETESMPDSFVKTGYPDYSMRPYVIKSYTSSEALNDAINLANNADVVVIGSAPEYFVKKRILDNKLTLSDGIRITKPFDVVINKSSLLFIDTQAATSPVLSFAL